MSRKLEICKLIPLTFLILTSYVGNSQTVTVKLGPDQIALNQNFTVTVTINNDRLKRYDNFPNIPGFRKLGTSSSSSTNIVNGRMSFSQSITQNYQPTKEGTFALAPFKMTVNGKNVSSAGKSIKVGPAIQRRQQRSPFGWDPFEDFFQPRKRKPQEFVDVKADAFLAFTTDKREVFVSEEFNAVLALYVIPNDQNKIDFTQLPEQLMEIKKKLKPSDCWEEDFSIEKLQPEMVTINNKQYVRYKLYQSSFFPLTPNPIEFPSVKLKMIKYKFAKQRSFFGRNKQGEYKDFYTKKRIVLVKELPDHPLKESVAVGNYRLSEKVDKKQLKTGDSFSYDFIISGNGNISAIESPETKSNENIDIFPPNTLQNIQRSNNHVTGKKTYSFYGIPKEPGSVELGDYFQWIYFNTNKEAYDTLKSKIVLTVTGESKKNEYIISNDLGSFYDIIDLEDNTLKPLHKSEWLRWVLNACAIGILGFAVYIKIKR